MDAGAPIVSRPHMPGYGIPEHAKGLLPWEHVIQRLAAALHYWVDTADAAGHVHATPIWGGVVDGTLYVEGGPGTRRGRNIAENPNVVVHLESGEDVVIMEGTAEHIVPPDPELARRLADEMESKYGPCGYHPAANQWNGGGLYAMRPRKVFAWTHFPSDTTRFIFPGEPRT